MTGAGDTSEIDEFTLDEGDDVVDEELDVTDDAEDDDESGTPLPPVGTDVQIDTSDPDPSAGASDIGGASPGPGDS
jgi:hypothetical protein